MRSSLFFLKGRLRFFLLFVLLSSCRQPHSTNTGDIGLLSLAWDQGQVPHLLFKYNYLSGTPDNAISETRYYQLNVLQPEAPVLTEIDQNTMRAKIPPSNMSGRELLAKNHKKLRPFPDDTIARILDYNIEACSLDPSQQWLLVAHRQSQPFPKTSELVYSLYQIEDKTYRNIKGLASIPGSSDPQREVILSWTGFGYDVLVEYEEKDRIYHARSQIDLNTAELKPLTVFKTYLKRESTEKRWKASFTPLSRQFRPRQDNENDVKVLVWESADKVLFLEKKANDKEIYLIKYDFKTQTESEMAKMERELSYYDSLFIREQISLAHKKVVYLIPKVKEGTDELWLSNFEGTERKMVLNRIRDLPVGLSEYVNATRIILPEIEP
ncbi:MAG: hypothetical protein AB7I41_02785 [Candidatus Sericytochromatia bacterium]